MPKLAELLEREGASVDLAPGDFERLLQRRERKRRNERIAAGALAIVVVVATLVGLSRTFGWQDRTATQPTPILTPAELGIFNDVRGWIAYGDTSGIWAFDPANPDAEHIQLSRSEGEPIAWSSDGSKLLISRPHNRGSLSFYSSLSVLDSDGTLTHVARGDGGSITPDGSKVIYSAALPGEEWRSGVYVVDVDGGTPRLLYAAGVMPGPDSFQMAVFLPTLSPDGSQIAYFEGMGDWGNSLWVMNADGSSRHQILGPDDPAQPGNEDSLSHITTPQWSPDGSRLAFSGTAPGDIYIVSADGSGLSLVDVHGVEPHWSPDGSTIAYASRGSLAIARLDGTLVRDLEDGRSGPWNPLHPLP